MLADLEFKLCNLENAARIGEIILSVPLDHSITSYIYRQYVGDFAATRILLRYHITDIIRIPTSATSPEAYIRCSEKKSTDICRLDLDLILDCSSCTQQI